MDEIVQDFRIPFTDETLTLLTDTAKKTYWWEIAYPMVSKSHAAGDFQLTTKNFEEIIDNFKTRSTGRIPICFEHHASLDASQIDPNVGSPAQGWVLNLEMRGSSLYAEVELFDRAKEYVKNKQYMFMSPAIRFGTRDKLTGRNVGCSMEELSLTNLPHLERQKGVWVNSNKNSIDSKNVSDKNNYSEYNIENMDEIEKLKLEIQKLTLSLQAKDGEIASLKEATAKEVKTLADKLASVEAERREREEEDAKVDVEEAFKTYQKLHGLKDAQKDAMLAFRLSDKKAFTSLYPRVSPADSTTPSFLTQTLTLNENTASLPTTIKTSKFSPIQLRDKQAQLTAKYHNTINPATGVNYDLSDAIKLACSDIKKEYELWLPLEATVNI